MKQAQFAPTQVLDDLSVLPVLQMNDGSTSRQVSEAAWSRWRAAVLSVGGGGARDGGDVDGGGAWH